MRRAFLFATLCGVVLAACPQQEPPAVTVVAQPKPQPDAAPPPPAKPPIADAGPLFEIQAIEREDPTMQFEIPIFHFGEREVDGALAEIVARDMEDAKRRYERIWARSAPKDPSGWFFWWKCAPTLVRPSLVSIR
jgi:hypothetical protein